MNHIHPFWLGYFAVTGLYLQYLARLYLRRSALLANAVRTSATVKEIRVFRDTDGPDLLTPVAEYKGKNGKTYTPELPGTTDPKKYKVGRSVPIKYEQGNPANAIPADGRWAGLRFHMFMCGLLVAFVVFAYVKSSLDGPPLTVGPAAP